MIKEAMEAKERQMVALGAKIVEQKQVQRTATEAELESSSEGSTLSSTAKKVQAAYVCALKWCALFVGVPATGIVFELNSDFDVNKMSPEERAEAIKEWQSGAITFEEMRAVLRKSGTATEDDAKAKEKIAQETAAAMAVAQPDNVPGDGSTPPNNNGA
jgi:DNA-binding protein H-NS